MKIKILVSSSGLYGSFVEGETADVCDECAKEFIRCKYAEPVVETKADKKAKADADKKAKADKKNK